jgi:hypothetical protein
MSNFKKIVILLTIALATAACFFISSFKKTIIFTGFAYKNDVIKISKSGRNFQAIVVTANENEKHICSFDEECNYYEFRGKTNFVIEIDSGKRKLLDTILNLTSKNEMPIISIEDPTKTNYRRSFFVIDQTDKGYMKF